MRKKLFLLLLAGVLLTGCGKTAQENATESETLSSQGTENTTEENAEEPYVVTFEAKTIEGEEFSSDSFSQSKLTMINVWATYCNPCLSEMPDLGEIEASYDSSEFQMIGVISDVMEGAEDADMATARELIEETQANYPHLLLSESLYTNLVGGIDSVPTTFFVNQEGEYLGYVVGAQSKEAWEEMIGNLLEDGDYYE